MHWNNPVDALPLQSIEELYIQFDKAWNTASRCREHDLPTVSSADFRSSTSVENPKS